MRYRFGIRYIDMVIYHIDMVILDIDMGYGLIIWEMRVSIRSSPISIWDICWHSTCSAGFSNTLSSAATRAAAAKGLALGPLFNST